MKETIERKTIFLYPDLDQMERTQFIEIQRLITKITLIVGLSNERIVDILSCGGFSKIKCMPSIEMKCADNTSTEDSKYNNVRICIVKFDKRDYTEYYDNIIEDYHKGTSDISHLVAVHISNKEGRVRFYKDENKKFDIIIETNLEHLGGILLAIMLDISIYHYFSLSRELDDRKNFNLKKCSYICETHKSDLKNIYGNESLNLNDDKFYLPFSLKDIYTFEMRTKKESKKEAITNLLREYAVFLAGRLSTVVELNENGKIISPYSYKNIDNFECIEKIIEDQNFDSNLLIILYKDNSTEKLKHIILKYNSDIEPWADQLPDEVNGYQLFKVILKENRGS